MLANFYKLKYGVKKERKKRPLQFDPIESRTEKLQEESKFKRNACYLHV